jgi:hypothetical protein
MNLRSRRTWSQLGLCVLSLAVASCASGPFAGVNPRDLGVPTAAANQGQEIRLNGTATLNGQPFPEATLRVVNLLSGEEVPLLLINSNDEAVPAPAGTKFETDKQARFNYGIRNLDPSTVYKVIAAKGDLVMTSLYDGQGRTLGKGAATYKLAQTTTQNRRVQVALEVSLETTIAAKAFEGVAKLNGLSDGDNSSLFQRIVGLLPQIANRLRQNPEAAAELAKQLDPSGEIKDPVQFKKLVDDTKVAEDLGPVVDEELEKAAKKPQKDDGGAGSGGTTTGTRGPVTEEDFPFGKVKVDKEKGQITFDDGKGKTFSANVPTGAKGNDGATPGNGQRPDGAGGAGGAGDAKDKGNNGVGPDGVRGDGTQPPGLGGPQGGNLDAGKGGAGGRGNRGTNDNPLEFSDDPTIFVTRLTGGQTEGSVSEIRISIASRTQWIAPEDNDTFNDGFFDIKNVSGFSGADPATYTGSARSFELPDSLGPGHYYVRLQAYHGTEEPELIGETYHHFYVGNDGVPRGLNFGLMLFQLAPGNRVLEASGAINVIGDTSIRNNIRRIDAFLLEDTASESGFSEGASPSKNNLWARLSFDAAPPSVPHLRLPALAPGKQYMVRLKAYDANGNLLSDDTNSLTQFETSTARLNGLLFDLALGGRGVSLDASDGDAVFATGWLGSSNGTNAAIQFNNAGGDGEVILYRMPGMPDASPTITLDVPRGVLGVSGGVTTATFEQADPAEDIGATWTVTLTLNSKGFATGVQVERESVDNNFELDVSYPQNTIKLKSVKVHKR